MEKFVNLSWKNHNAILSSIIHEYRLNNTFCDVTVACCGKFFPLHRLVLSTFSDYFKEILELAPCKHPFIIVQDIPLDDLKVLLDFIYIGEVAVLSHRVPTLLNTALKLRIRGLSNSIDINLGKETLDSNNSSHMFKSNLQGYDEYNLPRHTQKKKRRDSSKSNQEASQSESCQINHEKEAVITDKNCITETSQNEDIGPSSSSQSSLKMQKKRQKIHSDKSEGSLYSQSDPGKNIDNLNGKTEDLQKNPMEEAATWRSKEQGSAESAVEEICEPDSSKKTDQEVVCIDDDEDTPIVGECEEITTNQTLPGKNVNKGQEQEQPESVSKRKSNKRMSAELSSNCSVNDLTGHSPERDLKQELRDGDLEQSTIKVENEELFNDLQESDSPICYLNPELKLDILDEECDTQAMEKAIDMSIAEREATLQGLIPIRPGANFPGLSPEKEERPYKCNLCPKEFKVRSSLKGHKLIHSDERPFICPYCGKLFRQSGHLQQHKRIHTGEKPYRCNFCNKFFRQKAILNQHLRLHTGEKPYVCMECGLQFRQKATLDSHYQTHITGKFNPAADFNFAAAMGFPSF